jgi:hypothetical protein
VSASGLRSLSGSRLDGDRIVRLVYLDEAGLSKPSEEPFLVVAGIIIDADSKLTAIQRHLERIAVRNIRSESLDGFVFHAKEIFNGGGKVFKREKSNFVGPVEWPLARRLELADEIARIPAKFDLPVAIGFIDRETFLTEYGVAEKYHSTPGRTVLEHVIAFTQASVMVEQWMREHASDEVCLLISEDNDQARSMIRSAQNFYQDPKKVVTIRDYKEVSLHFPFRKIKEDPLFQPKKRSHPTIIADFCAYVFKKFLMQDANYRQFLARFQGNLIAFDEAALRQRQERRAQKGLRFDRRQAPERPQ